MQNPVLVLAPFWTNILNSPPPPPLSWVFFFLVSVFFSFFKILLRIKINSLALVYLKINFLVELMLKINNLSRQNFPVLPSLRIKWSPLPKTRAPRGTDRSPEYNEHFCSKGWLCVPIHIHALVHPPPFHLNKFIKNLLKFLKHLNLLYKYSSNYKHWNYTK